MKVLLLLALLCAAPWTWAADAVAITAVVGFADTFQPGRWTPLSVTVSHRGGDLSGDLSGELEVQVSGGDPLRGRQFVTRHRRALDLHRDSRKTLHFTVLPQTLSQPLVIRVQAGGRTLARTEVDLRTRVAAGRLILVLSRDAQLDYLNDPAADGLRVRYPHPELLPAHWRGYDAVAAVVVHGVSLERLSPSQFEALHKWIAQGGILAVSGGPDYALLRSPRIAALLPGAPAGMTRVDAAALQQAFATAVDVSRPVHVNRLDTFRGVARLRAGAVPLIVERALGLGRVLYLTFDVAGYPFAGWDGMRQLWLDNLRLPPSAKGTSSAAETVIENPLPPLIQAESPHFPAHATAILFLALYLGLLLAGYSSSLRGTRTRWLAPLWCWVAPVPFAAAAWLLFGPAVFPRGGTAVTVATIEPLAGSRYARLGLEVGVYGSRSGALRLDYRGAEPVWYPPRQLQREGTAQDWVLGEGSRRFLEPLDQRRYVLHALQGEDVIAFHLEATVHAETPGPRLVLDNASGRALEAVWLVFDGYAYALGDIAAGARFERGLSRLTHGVEVGETAWQHVLRPSPAMPAQMQASARILLERKSRMAGAGGYPASGHALLVGYTTSPLQPAGTSADWPRRERTLVMLQLAAVPSTVTGRESGKGPQGPNVGTVEHPASPRVSGAATGAAAH